MPAVGHGEKGRLGTAIESSAGLGPPAPRRPDPERSSPALLPGSPLDSCLPLSRRGTGGEGGRGGATARKSRPHPLSAGPLGPAPPCHAPPLAVPGFPLRHRARPLPGSPSADPCSSQLWPAPWLGSLSLSGPGPAPPAARSRPLCQARLFPAANASESLAPPLSARPRLHASLGSSQFLPAPRFSSLGFPSRLLVAQRLSPLSLEGGPFR